MNIIVKRIDELRKIKGMTKKEMADVSGIPRSSVNNWYYSDAMPSLGNLASICKTLDITVEQFFSGFGSEKISERDEEFLDGWRMLSVAEKATVAKVMEMFKALKAVNDD